MKFRTLFSTIAIAITSFFAAPCSHAQALKLINLSSAQSITATGGLNDSDISARTGNIVIGVTTLNTAGTSPTLAIKLQNSDPMAIGYSQVAAGSSTNKLRAGATTTVKLGAVFTQSGARSIKTATLTLLKAGTITAGTVIQADIFATSASLPTGSTLGTSATILTDNISATAAPVTFTWANPVDLADATVYAVVLSGNYTASTSNYISWRSLTVASAGNQATFDNTNWTAVATENFEVYLNQYSFSDVTSGAFTSVTTGAGFSTLTFWVEDLKAIIRPYVTIGGSASPAYDVSSTAASAR